MDRIRFFESEKSRSATFWILNLVLVSFFLMNQMEIWLGYDNGKFHHCSGCPYSSSGMEVIWMAFSLLGAYITKPCLNKEGNRLFHKFLKWPLFTLVLLTGIKISLRFCYPNSASYWRVGLLLEFNWLYISITNLSIWIYQNWRKDFSKTKHGWLTLRQHCILFYGLPAALMLITAIWYRALEFTSADQTSVMIAMSCSEAAYVLSPIKASISWHFRP